MPLKPVRRGERISRRLYNQTQDAIPQNISGTGGVSVHHSGKDLTIRLDDDRIIPATGTGTGAGMLEVAIDKIVNCDSPFDQGEIDGCETTGGLNHFKTWIVNAQGEVEIAEDYTPVFPNHGHSIFEYSAVQWDAFDPNQPVFTALSGARGFTLVFNEGETLVPPPTSVCGDAPTGGTGACCVGNECSEPMSSKDCAAGGGTYQGDGSTCTPDPCLPSSPACCTDGQCQSMLPEDCTAGGGIPYDDAAACIASGCEGAATGACCTGDFICIPDQTPGECKANPAGGTYQGDGITCTPGLCDQGGKDGVCCLSDNTCDDTFPDQETCEQISNSTWIPGVTCIGDPCTEPIGCCCIGGNCFANFTPTDCDSALGQWFPDKDAACDLCNAAC